MHSPSNQWKQSSSSLLNYSNLFQENHHTIIRTENRIHTFFPGQAYSNKLKHRLTSIIMLIIVINYKILKFSRIIYWWPLQIVFHLLKFFKFIGTVSEKILNPHGNSMFSCLSTQNVKPRPIQERHQRKYFSPGGKNPTFMQIIQL